VLAVDLPPLVREATACPAEVRERLPFQLISRHVNSHQDDERDFADLTRPEQLNVLTDHRATAALDELRAAGQTTELYLLPACQGYLRDGIGYITSRERRTLRPNSLSASFEITYKNATSGQTRSMTPSAGLLSISQCRTH
jgi:hypothetical protein